MVFLSCFAQTTMLIKGLNSFHHKTTRIVIILLVSILYTHTHTQTWICTDSWIFFKSPHTVLDSDMKIMTEINATQRYHTQNYTVHTRRPE